MSTVNNDFYSKIESNLISNNTDLIKPVILPSVDKNILINMYKFKKNDNLIIENFYETGEAEAEGEAESEAEGEAESEAEGEAESEAEGEAEEEEETVEKVVPTTPAPTTPAPTTPAPTEPVLKIASRANYRQTEEKDKLQIDHNIKVMDHCKFRCIDKLKKVKRKMKNRGGYNEDDEESEDGDNYEDFKAVDNENILDKMTNKVKSLLNLIF